MRFFTAALVFVLGLWSVTSSELDENEDYHPLTANLIVRKSIVADYHFLAIGQNFSVVMDVYNVGEGDAYNVEVNDNWPHSETDPFEIVEGVTTHSWDDIPSNGHVSYNFTLVPKQSGELTGFRAQVQYQPSAESAPMFAYSTSSRNTTILPIEYYIKYTSKYYFEWTTYILGTCASFLIPLFLYINLQKNFESGLPKKQL